MMYPRLILFIDFLMISMIHFSVLGQNAQLIKENGNASIDYINFYQQHISEHKNSVCPMYPSCSAYGKMVFNDKPFYEAMSLVADRLLRCSHERQYYEVTYINGAKRYIDYPYYKNVPVHLFDTKQFPHTDILKRNSGRDNSKLFIEYLINKEEYQAALLEIERLLFVQQLQEAYLYSYKLLCYRGLKEYEKGIYEYETTFPTCVKDNIEIRMQLALLNYSVDNVEGTINSIESVLNDAEDSLLLNKAHVLKGLVQLKENNWIGAEENINIASRLLDNPMIHDKNMHLIMQMKNQRKKNPTTARLLSLIPGAGYLYANHKGSALVALFMNSLFAYSTYTSIKSKNYGLAGLCGFLSLSFYIGNINGAGRSAIRYNERVKNNGIREIEYLNNIFIN